MQKATKRALQSTNVLAAKLQNCWVGLCVLGLTWFDLLKRLVYQGDNSASLLYISTLLARQNVLLIAEYASTRNLEEFS